MAGWESLAWNVALLHAVQSSAPLVGVGLAMLRLLCELPLAGCALLVAACGVVGRHRRLVVTAGIAAALCVASERVTAALAAQPRPFAAGYSLPWVMHEANNAFPSTHVALAWAVTMAFLAARRLRPAATCAVLTALMAWARVATGLHWPLDIVGAVALASVASAAAWRLVARRPIPTRSEGIP